MGESKPSQGDQQMLISYRLLRKSVGLVGIMLPVQLLIYSFIFENSVRDSISSYYWPSTRDLSEKAVSVWSPTCGILVGSLCSIGVFLWAYCGDQKWDARAGNLACVTAVGVALFPCSPVDGDRWTHVVHFPSAAVPFILLAYFCLVSFPTQDPGTTPTHKKPLRNKLYRCCGAVILLCIVTIASLHLFYGKQTPGSSVFWLESAAVWVFGWAWYIKGQGLGFVQD